MALDGMPDELFEEILARLPVKSLVRFRSLSKFHCGLMKKNRFITKHFQFSADNPCLLIFHCPFPLKPAISMFCDEFSQIPSDLGLAVGPMLENLQAALDLGLDESQTSVDLGLLISETSQGLIDLGLPFEETQASTNLGLSQFAFDLGLLSHPPFELPIPQLSHLPVDLELPFPDEAPHLRVPYGPCNGIFCLYARYRDGHQLFVLWNPATREVKALPSSHLPHGGVEMFHGFGFDPKTKDYKVVCILLAISDESQRAFVEVYSLSTDSWRRINVTLPAFDLEHSFCYSYLNGVYHWLARHSRVIVCFDLNSEVFYKMKLPLVVKDYTYDYFTDCRIAVFNDCIAFVKEYHRFSLGLQIDIWLMNEHGVEESWSKYFSIGPMFGVSKFCCFWKDGEILVKRENSSTLISYKLDTQQPVLKFPIPDGSLLFSAIRYVESIFPISVLSDEEACTT